VSGSRCWRGEIPSSALEAMSLAMSGDSGLGAIVEADSERDPGAVLARIGGVGRGVVSWACRSHRRLLSEPIGWSIEIDCLPMSAPSAAAAEDRLGAEADAPAAA
jgi:hypothetical protein